VVTVHLAAATDAVGMAVPSGARRRGRHDKKLGDVMPLPESARELLRKQAYGHVATTNANGSPQLTMVWVDEDGGDLVFNTAAGRLKTRNLERDPSIAVSVQDPENPQRYLLVRGTAAVGVEGADEQIDHLAQKFLGQERYPLRRPDEQRLFVRVPAERVGGQGPWVG
jgi:PPOX class probable F420-dependent enzyme